MRQELKSSLCNAGFLMGFIVILICTFGISIPEWIISNDWGAEYRQSALQQSISGIFFGGVMLLVPFSASLPYAIKQVDELQTSIMRWKLLRSSTFQYALSKIMATTLSGGLVASLAFAFHSLLWNIIALPCDPITYPYHEITFAKECLYATWYSKLYGLPMYISMAIGIFICGAVWATIALTVAIWFSDRLLTISIPVCIYYLLSANVFRHLLGWEIPHPATLYNDALTILEAKRSLFEYLVLFTIACIVYIVGLKRRAQHA